MRQYLFSIRPIATDLGLLLLRVVFGLLLIQYGWEKFSNYASWSKDFPDPLHVGHAISLALCIFAELICAALLVVGIFSRVVLVPLIINMLVVIFIVHGNDPFKEKEHAISFLVPFVVLFLTGPGNYSIDAGIRKR